MNRFQLFRLLRRHSKLGYRRNPAFEQSVIAKVMMIIGAGFAIIYMICGGTALAVAANSDNQPAFILVLLPLMLLAIDFLSRFAVQQTPLMQMKPYLLMPLPRKAVIETFLVTSLCSGYNWIWLALFVPYCIVILAGGTPFLAAMGILLSGMLLLLANSQFYLLIRTLIGRSLLWWAVPVVVYGIWWAPLLLDKDGKVLSDFLDGFVEMAGSWWFPLACLALLAVLFWVNRATQFRFVYEEISKEEKKPKAMKTVTQFTFLERFGQAGEYLKLELKSIFRNKSIRSRVLMSLTLIVVLTLLIAYTNVYDGRMMLNFWCIYCYGIYGMTTLVKIMGPEGNYIDLLMTHRENILSLLKAKYYFHVAILFVPLLLMLPAVFAGKFSILMMLAYLLLSSGLLYFMLFQLAVYNKQTLPLDQKLTGKNNVENGMQLAIELVAMFLPLVMVAILVYIFDEDTAYVILAVIGLAFTLAHPWWLRNIYKRMMGRKYENLEGFHATRL